MFLPPTCEKIECRIEYANKHLNKKAKEKKQVARKALKQFNDSDKSILKRLAQKIFNQYIRMRDKDLPCVSCNKIISENEVSHASHFRPATNSRLRFDERNVHRSCVKCNVFLSSNAIEYKKALIIKLGVEVVEELENTNEPYRYTTEELQEITTKYRQKIKEMV
jgi:prefoldin subunit 5